ncbi:unnamed protein product [Linum tenue]|uniref:Uncharacterized protein n=1 Tax=Linum tenue TaxID=586396 RepID=A0AAV0MGI7_9ROSI|nr:unnamed protein product [Linum tenue]
MTEPEKPPPTNLPSSSAPTESNPVGKSTAGYSGQKPHFPNPPDATAGYSGQKPHFPNPPDAVNPDPATLREQWQYATKKYSRWYSQAWGSAILAGLSFFALGWVIKGGNPLPSFKPDDSNNNNNNNPSSSETAIGDAPR